MAGLLVRLSLGVRSEEEAWRYGWQNGPQNTRLIPIELQLQRLGTAVSNAIGTAKWVVPVIVTIAMEVMALVSRVIVSANS